MKKLFLHVLRMENQKIRQIAKSAGRGSKIKSLVTCKVCACVCLHMYHEDEMKYEEVEERAR